MGNQSYIGFKLEGKVFGEGRRADGNEGIPGLILNVFSCRERSENDRDRMTLVLVSAFLPEEGEC